MLRATIGEVFPYVMRDPIEDTNTLIVASEAPLSAERAAGPVPDLPHALKPTALAAARRLDAPSRAGTSTPTTRRRWSG